MKINNILNQVRDKGSVKAETQVELAEALETTQPVIKHIIKNIIRANQNGYKKPKKGADYRDFLVIVTRCNGLKLCLGGGYGRRANRY